MMCMIRLINERTTFNTPTTLFEKFRIDGAGSCDQGAGVKDTFTWFESRLEI